jgi:uncharacterized protein YndB with AHSA1/START domain
MNSITDVAVLEIKRVFDAAPALVFDAWTNREEWQSWIGPEGVNCDVPLLDARVGGRYSVVMHLSEGRTIHVAGEFKAIEKPKRLVFTWGPASGPQVTLVTITLREMNGKTELTLRHEGLENIENRDSHGKGWNSALNKLVRYLGHKVTA